MLGNQLLEKDLPETLSIDSCNHIFFHGTHQTAAQTSAWNLAKVMKSLYGLLH